jgi:hypothetical protein
MGVASPGVRLGRGRSGLGLLGGLEGHLQFAVPQVITLRKPAN